MCAAWSPTGGTWIVDGLHAASWLWAFVTEVVDCDFTLHQSCCESVVNVHSTL
jgi:hypothetical protein